MFLNAFVKVVLLFGSDTWVMTPCMVWDLGGVSTQGIHTDHCEATKVAGRWELGTTAAEDGDAGGGV